MNTEYIFNVWAPPGAPWSPWVKPVLFAHVDPLSVTEPLVLPESEAASWMPQADGATVLVLDLPTASGVLWAAICAQRGFRPVPLYNALPSAEPFMTRTGAVCDVQPIIDALAALTPDLDKLNLPYEAPPAFLLDSLRRIGGGATPTPGMFDNRSVSLPTDFPSTIRLQSAGVRRVVLVQLESLEPQEDLAHTLLRWQRAGIAIEASAVHNEAAPIPINVRKPYFFRLFWQRLLATWGLRRSPLGGFGGNIPIPSSSAG